MREDVVGCSAAGDLLEGAASLLQIGEHEFLGKRTALRQGRRAGSNERGLRLPHEIRMSHVCDLGPFTKRLDVESLDKSPAQIVDPGERFRGYRQGSGFRPSTIQIRLVRNEHSSSASRLFQDLPIDILERFGSV